MPEIHLHPKRFNHRLWTGCVVFTGSAMLASCVHGDELIISDVRLGLESMPTNFSYTVTDGNHSATGTSNFEYGFGSGIRGLYAFSAPGRSSCFFVGSEIEGSEDAYVDDGRYQSFTLRALGGYAWAFEDRWQLEVEPWVGYGVAKLNIPSNSLVSAIDASGHVLEYGLDFGVTYQFSTHWLVSARVGWEESTARLSGDGLSIVIKPAGPTGFLGLTYRFGGQPPPIQ